MTTKLKHLSTLLMVFVIVRIYAQNTIIQHNVQKHLTYICADDMKGREPELFPKEYKQAQEYVVKQFEEIGLTKGVDNAWYQHINFKKYIFKKGDVSLLGTKIDPKKYVLSLTSQNVDMKDVALVFVGYGLDDKQLQINDYEGLDVKGKIVVLKEGFPSNIHSDIQAHLNIHKVNVAIQKGAAGVIFLSRLDDKMPWDVRRDKDIITYRQNVDLWINAQGKGECLRRQIGVGPVLYLDPETSRQLFSKAPLSLNQLDTMDILPKGFALHQTMSISATAKVFDWQSANVVGMIPGSDGTLTQEYLVIFAHLDHMGIDKKTQDVYNGVVDNGVGVSCVIEMARILAKEKLRRTIYFVITTGEEKGLLGADYFAQNPPWQKGKAIFGTSIDDPTVTGEGKEYMVYGDMYSEDIKNIAHHAVNKMGSKVLEKDPLANEGIFVRSDHYAYIKQGVPSLFLIPMDGLSDFLKKYYHTPFDDLKNKDLVINWNTVENFIHIDLDIIKTIANKDLAPQWNTHSYFH